jgi:hypothetical protein
MKVSVFTTCSNPIERQDACTGDWVIRCDLDYIFHQNDIKKIKNILSKEKDKAGFKLCKKQFVLIDRFNIKSRVTIGFNKGKYGDRIKLNSGGDLCQPSLDNKELSSKNCLYTGDSFYNYDFCWKTKDVIHKDFSRFARTWLNHFKKADFGGPDNDSAFKFFVRMGKTKSEKPSNIIKIGEHPLFVINKIKKMTPEMFGYNLWGNTKKASYF